MQQPEHSVDSSVFSTGGTMTSLAHGESSLSSAVDDISHGSQQGASLESHTGSVLTDEDMSRYLHLDTPFVYLASVQDRVLASSGLEEEALLRPDWMLWVQYQDTFLTAWERLDPLCTWLSEQPDPINYFTDDQGNLQPLIENKAKSLAKELYAALDEIKEVWIKTDNLIDQLQSDPVKAHAKARFAELKRFIVEFEDKAFLPLIIRKGVQVRPPGQEKVAMSIKDQPTEESISDDNSDVEGSADGSVRSAGSSDLKD